MTTKDIFNKGADDGLDKELSKCADDLASSGGGGSRNYFKVQDGEDGNKIRILPPLKGINTPWYHVKIHFNLMGSNGKKLPVLCGLDTFDECPLCTDAQIFREQGDNLKAWNASAKDMFLYNIIDAEGNFAVLSAPKGLQQELIKQFKFARSEDGGQYSPWDIEEGCYVKVVKTKGKKEGNQKFAPNIWGVHLLKKTAVDAKLLEVAPDSMHNLKEIYRVFNVEELTGLLNGTFNPFEKKEETTTTESVTTAATPEVTTITTSKVEEVSPPVTEDKSDEVDAIIDETDELTKKFLEK